MYQGGRADPHSKEWKKDLDSRGYSVGEAIGKGHYSTVYQASKGGKNLALKAIDLQSCTEKYRSKFIPRELKLIQKVKHDNIIETVEVIKDPGRAVFIIMAFARTNLHDEIKKRGKVDEHQAKIWLGGIANALNYLHSLNYVHRDIKPDNVLIMSDAQAVLSDFSFTKQMPNQTDLTNTSCGTTYYMAPEVLVGEWYNPFLADVWSFGVVIYDTLIGNGPFKTETRPEFKEEQKKIQEIIYKSSLQDEAKGLVKQMMQYSEKERIPMSKVADHIWFKTQMPLSPPQTPAKPKVVDESPIDLSAAEGQKTRPKTTSPIRSPNETKSSPIKTIPCTTVPAPIKVPSQSDQVSKQPLRKTTTPEKSKSGSVPVQPLKQLTFTWSSDVNKVIKEKGYTIQEVIARGIFANIYRGTRNKKSVAIKVVELQMAPANYREKFFPREEHFLKNFHHANIIRLFDVFVERNKRFFIFMELAKSDLRKELDSAPDHKIPETQAKIWLENVAQALNYLHSMYYCHRDLKPENILIRSQNHAMISDFTHVKQQPQTVLSKTFIEPTAYLSPQMLRRQPYSPFSADIWSFGVIIFETLNGSRLLKHDKIHDVRKEQESCEDKISASQLPDQPKKLVSRMVRFKEKDRVPMGVVVRDQWFRTNV